MLFEEAHEDLEAYLGRLQYVLEGSGLKISREKMKSMIWGWDNEQAGKVLFYSQPVKKGLKN